MDKQLIEAIEAAYPVPAHIMACAAAIRYDLYFGPCFSRIPQGDITKFTRDCYSSEYAYLEEDNQAGDVIEETYTGKVADALRDFIAQLPGDVYVEACSGLVTDGEPDWDELDPSDWHRIDSSGIVEALFGKLIAKEFN